MITLLSFFSNLNSVAFVMILYLFQLPHLNLTCESCTDCLWFPTPLGYTFCSFHARDSRLTREARETTKKSAKIILFYLPNSNKFSDWRRTCHVSRVIGQNFMTPSGNNNLNFRLARDQVVQF